MGERVRNRDAFVYVQHVAFLLWRRTTERGLLGLGVRGYQYILLIAEMKAWPVCYCPRLVSGGKRHIGTQTDIQIDDKDRQLHS